MASLLDMAQARLQGLLDIPTRATRALVNPTLFSGLLGAPTLPQQQGMAEAAYGLPARQNMSVLDPKQAAYLEGYQQGEPLSYLGMATPFAAPTVAAGAKAVAPKAGMALENYMASQGLLQPLIAYHGTPHTIKGKFDISKVGTGEGAQAYGHGMYFAENPKVAEGYRHMLSVDPNVASEKIQFATLEKFANKEKNAVKREIQAFIDGTGNYNDFVRIINEQGSKQFKNALLKDEPNLFGAGNLYKVDIPDEYIPNMLDWDKPISEQSQTIQTAAQQLMLGIKKLATEADLSKLNGQGLYKLYQQYRGNNPDFASEGMNELGIKGIRYLDEGSRGKPYAVAISTKKGPYAESNFATKEQAEEYIKEKQAEGFKTELKNIGTSNFVVFDPSTVKILEENSKPVSRKELIKKQVNKLKD